MSHSLLILMQKTMIVSILPIRRGEALSHRRLSKALFSTKTLLIISKILMKMGRRRQGDWGMTLTSRRLLWKDIMGIVVQGPRLTTFRLPITWRAQIIKMTGLLQKCNMYLKSQDTVLFKWFRNRQAHLKTKSLWPGTKETNSRSFSSHKENRLQTLRG